MIKRKLSQGTPECPEITFSHKILPLSRNTVQTVPVFLSFRQRLKSCLERGHLCQIGKDGFPK